MRDATFTLLALIEAGYLEEAHAWRDWLVRAVAGSPSDLQIMYGVSGERRLTEFEVPWMPGYEGSSPVRVGNAASEQFQLDVYGELFDANFHAMEAGADPDADLLNIQIALLEWLEGAWHRPDDGIWEVRGPRQHFVHSKVMAWVAFDRAVRACEMYHIDNDDVEPVEAPAPGDPRPGLRRGLRHREAGVHPGVRLEAHGRRGAHDAARRVPARDRRPRRRTPSGSSSVS